MIYIKIYNRISYFSFQCFEQMWFGCKHNFFSHVPIKESNGVKSGKHGDQENSQLLPIDIILKKENFFKVWWNC